MRVKALHSILGLSALHFVAAIEVFAYIWNPGDDTDQDAELA